MFNKLYDEMKRIISESKIFIIVMVLLTIILNIKLPYYIEASGKMIDLKTRIDVKDSYNSKGSFNMTYVAQRPGTVLNLIIAKFNDNWDIIKKNDVIYDNETIEDDNIRGSILLKQSNNDALTIALDKAHIPYTENNLKIYIIYLDKKSNTDLKVGDEIIEVDGIEIKNHKMIIEHIRSLSKDTIVKFKIKRNNKIKVVDAKTFDYDGNTLIGAMLGTLKDVKTNQQVKFNFKSNEYGPSAGFMTALQIYNSLVKKDLTNGLKIAGTGTIDSDGNVGNIDGIKYKLKGAINSKADIFFVPAGDNYKEAKKIVEKNNYKIKLVSIKTFDQAINYLTDYSK